MIPEMTWPPSKYCLLNPKPTHTQTPSANKVLTAGFSIKNIWAVLTALSMNVSAVLKDGEEKKNLLFPYFTFERRTGLLTVVNDKIGSEAQVHKCPCPHIITENSLPNFKKFQLCCSQLPRHLRGGYTEHSAMLSPLLGEQPKIWVTPRLDMFIQARP